MKRFFYFLSKTDKEFMSLPGAAIFRSQQIVKGLLVLATGLFGSAVALYGIWSVSNSFLLAAVCGGVYGAIITLLNRELVTLGDRIMTPVAKFFRALLPLLLITVCSSLFSFPLQSRLFNSPIFANGDVVWTFLLTALLLTAFQSTPMLVGWLTFDNEYASLAQSWRDRMAKLTEKQIRDFSFTPSTLSNRPAPDAYSGLTLPSFGSGFASAMDWFGDLAPTVKEFRGGERTLDEARDAALARDWAMIGRDLQNVLDRYGEESAKPAA
jgi:hypothetical protein